MCRSVPLWVAALLVAGCPKAAPPGPAVSEGLEVSIVPEADSFPPWEKSTARVQVRNPGSVPVLILAVSLKTNLEKAALNRNTTIRLPSAAKSGKQIATGEFLMENMHPAVARVPPPPRWEWKQGPHEIVTGVVIEPGGRADFQGTFRARYEAAGSFVGTVSYVPVVNPPIVMYELAETKSVPLKSPVRTTSKRGNWEAVEKVQLVFQPIKRSTVLKDPTIRRSVSRHAFAVYPYAITAAGLATRERSTATAELPLVVDRFAYDIADARSKCGVPADGAYTHLLNAKLWVLGQADAGTCLAGPETKKNFGGDLLSLVDTLNDKGSAQIGLFDDSSHPDPGGLVGYFRQKGFSADSKVRKGMTYDGLVTVTPENLVSFLEAADAKGLYLPAFPGGLKKKP